MRKIISHYQDTRAVTGELLQWLADPASHGCTGVLFSGNCSLTEEASKALVESVAAQTIQSLEFHEVLFTPAQLEEMLAMPALTDLRIWGGESYDWNGPRYVWDTLGIEHIDALASSPHAQRLRHLEILNQNFSEVTGGKLRVSLPNLETLRIEENEY